MLKQLEIAGKSALALLASALFFRPFRGTAQALELARSVLLVRVDNRVGEALLMTPLLTALAEAGYRVSVLCHPRVARVLQGHPSGAQVLPWDRRRLWLGPFSPGFRALRRTRFDAVVDCSNWTHPSVTAALVAQLAAKSAPVIGPAAFPVRNLRDVPVRARQGTRSEVVQRLHLLSPLLGQVDPRPLSFRPSTSTARLKQFMDELPRPFAVVNPGGRLGHRRIDPAAFGAVASALAQEGLMPVITFGPEEEPLAKVVETMCPEARRAPPTDLDELAQLMRQARLVVCNNTGPMHLSVAVGTPTLAFFLHMEVARWGHSYPPHQMVDLTPFTALGALKDAAASSARDFFNQISKEKA